MNRKPIILIVEDDKAIRNLISTTLSTHDYKELTATNGKEALLEASTHQPDIILLDLGLPDMDGVDVIKKIRTWSNIPIIVVSARGEDQDKIEALDAGGDDYLTKPFSPREVIARIKAISRRITSSSDEGGASQPAKVEKEFYEYAGFTVDLAKVSVARNGERVKLTPKECEFLAYFVKRPGRVLSREKLLNGVWGYDYVGQTRMVDMHVSHLREKLEDDPKHPVYIQTARGFGYRFNGDAK